MGGALGATGATNGSQGENNSKFLDITKVYNCDGFSPLHFAAYKNCSIAACILCQYVIENGTGHV